MFVQVVNKQKALPFSSRQVKALVNEIVFFEKKAYDEVAIHFINKRVSSQMHQQYFQDPSPTDCLSFPIDMEHESKDSYKMLGDVFVCPEVAIEYAQKNNCDPYEELSLYVVHGVLHLMGYDDLDPVDRKKMRGAERRHMKHLKAEKKLLTALERKK